MEIRNQLFTSESVSEGHPDKLCDRISDAILDYFIMMDKKSRVACETMASHKKIIISAEITSRVFGLQKNDGDTKSFKDKIIDIVKKVIRDTGYSKIWDYDPDDIDYDINITAQSPHIAQGVDIGGAGDQGVMFGYATDETGEMMPAPILYAHNLLLRYSTMRKRGVLENAGPDGKSQVSFYYDSEGKPRRIDRIVLSVQHNINALKDGKVSGEFKEELIEKIIKPICGDYIDKEFDTKNIFINPTGSFLKGGPAADTGLTGRKIIVDTYGGMAPHGGGAFSGKDPTKVDRSAAYMARYVAKTIVSNHLAKKCLIQVSYAIGVSEPLSIMVNTFGTGKISDDKLVEIVKNKFDFRPQAIIERLDLLKPIYYETAAYGHFGREKFSWEKIEPLTI